MKWAGYLLSSLWRIWFLMVFTLVFAAFIPGLFLFTSIYKNKTAVCHLARYWSKLILFFSFIHPHIEWEEKLNKHDNYIFCPNHASTLDIPFILAILPIPLQFIGKSEIAKIPLFGYFYKNNAVIVDRGNNRNAYTAFLKASDELKNGLSMCFFPEGGIPNKNILLKPFKNGPFRLAVEQNIKIVPITIADNKNIFPQEYFKGRPGIVRVKIHKAITSDSKNKNEIEMLKLSVYNTIFEQLHNYGSK